MKRLEGPRDDALVALAPPGEDPTVRSFFDKGQTAEYGCGAAVARAGEQRVAHPGRIAYRDPVDGAVPVIIDLPKSGPHLDIGAEAGSQGVEKFESLLSQAHAEASRIPVSLADRSAVRCVVGMGAVDHGMDEPCRAVLPCHLPFELPLHIGVHIGVVEGVLRGHAGAVYREAGEGAGGHIGAALLVEAVDTHHVHIGVHRLADVLRLLRIGVFVGPVGRDTAVAREAMDFSAPRGDPGGSPVVVGVDDRLGDLAGQEVEKLQVEPPGVCRVHHVEVAPQEVARAGMGMGPRHHDPPHVEVGLPGHHLGQPAVHQFGARQEVALDQGHGPFIRRLEVDDAGVKAGAKALPVFPLVA